MNYIAKPVGSFYKDSACEFVVWAPQREQVSLIINDKTYPLRKDDLGYWSATIKEAGPGTQYKYQLDGDKILPDPASRAQTQGVHGPSSVVDPEFNWNDSDWMGIPLGEMIMYELHVGTFTKEGTFASIIPKLPYLKDLGVNAIELMPVAQFPGSRNWGYDGVYPFAVQDSYGGVKGLKELVNECHRQGIAVVQDVVYNHLGPEGNYLSEYGPYFTDKYKTNWGKAINYDDAWCDGVRSYYWQNALMWLDEFHIDGLRLDAVHAIWDVSSKHFIDELRMKVRQLEQETGRKKVLIAEFDLNNPRYISSPEKGGYGLDGQWVDEFHHALRSLITEDYSGYYEDFGTAKHLAKAFKDSYVYTGEYSKHRKKFFGSYPETNTFDQFVVFSQNHDQVGNRMLGDRLTHNISYEALKLAAAAVILSPYVPMLFMGEEYGEKNPFQYFISHTDKELVELVRKGRKEEFSYFKWEGEVPDPQGEETFKQCILSWNYEKDEKSNTLLSFYKRLISIRKGSRALQNKQRQSLNILFVDDATKVIALQRQSDNERMLLAFNFNKAQQTFNNSEKFKLKKLFDSSSKEWLGPGEITSSDESASIKLNPESVLIFEIQ
ncbi:malto-oligosyltrehalose trehalohydrolase [Chryseosolibacter indicus]|uniref:Malto-oligosyltrehalose trehalohydrolase n=1 Tax=Chryseosolibacter indicus TaxID=2782351 RepID=A0ABS5VLY5_9BACT|nr:malto-oligosyltrehalose trehalohydrolase [Chryseosolibacter indicus]MBT1701782.1 malto-oligosyltrehalose trehalohydrolase [Chryseosolibacter indicus]